MLLLREQFLRWVVQAASFPEWEGSDRVCGGRGSSWAMSRLSDKAAGFAQGCGWQALVFRMGSLSLALGVGVGEKRGKYIALGRFCDR